MLEGKFYYRIKSICIIMQRQKMPSKPKASTQSSFS